MPDHRTLSLGQLADSLNIGEKTLNVWRNRYRKWIPQPVDDEALLYPERVVEVFRFINRCTHAGMEPDDIERALEAGEKKTQAPERHKEAAPGLDSALQKMAPVIEGLVAQQRRIADAQERRATAEERKAYAMESRAEAELIRANAMRDIVSLFQDVSVKDSVSLLMEKVRNMPAPSAGELKDFAADMGYTPEQIETLPELDVTGEQETVPIAEARESSVPPAPRQPLAQEDPLAAEAPPGEEAPPFDIDDLSRLLDPEDREPANVDIDNLSLLLEDEAAEGLAPEDIDDLSALLDDVTDTPLSPSAPADDVDDLSLLLEPDDAPTGPSDAPAPENQAKPELKDEAPSSGDYKSQILKRIIHMKQKENLSVDQTTQRFNEEGVKTLSGKGVWDRKTIQGIYTYIDSVQGK